MQYAQETLKFKLNYIKLSEQKFQMILLFIFVFQMLLSNPILISPRLLWEEKRLNLFNEKLKFKLNFPIWQPWTCRWKEN